MHELDRELVKLEQGSIVKGKVVSVRYDEVFVDVGYKAEGVIPLSELAYPPPANASEVIQAGDIIDVYVIDADSNEGALKLSKLRADQIVVWDKLEEALQDKQVIECKVLENVKGGLSVSVLGIRGFIPASQADIKFVQDLTEFVGQNISALPIEVDPSKKRVVLSRRAILEEERRRKEEEIYSRITPGQVVKGKVRRLAEFGVFVDIGGVDGLIHISDLAWHRVKSPAEIVSVDDEIEATVLKVDPAAKKISLSLKAVQRDPWYDVADELAVGKTVKGKVTKISKFGVFVEIAKGVEGLVHLSELSDQHVNKAEEAASIGQEVPVKILAIDRENKRISLSIAQARQEADRAEYSRFIESDGPGMGFTIGEKLGHLFRRDD